MMLKQISKQNTLTLTTRRSRVVSVNVAVETDFKKGLFADNLDEHPFFSLAVKLTVENLLPGTKMQPPFCDGNNDFPTHNLALMMGITVILSGSVVLVTA